MGFISYVGEDLVQLLGKGYYWEESLLLGGTWRVDNAVV